MKWRIARNLGGILGTTGLFYLALHQLENSLLRDIVYPVANISFDHWIDKFNALGFIGLIVALLSSLLWYITAEWFLKINSSRRNSGRIIWAIIFFPPGITAVGTMFLIPGTSSGLIFSAVLHVVNITLSYYLATALFSPSAFKYTPLLAKSLRRFW